MFRDAKESTMYGKALVVSLSVIFITSTANAGQKVTISSNDCKRLAKNFPSATYKPGVDVRGNKVVGANLKGSEPALKVLPPVISFDISRDFSKYGGSSDTSVGKVKFDIMSGKLTFNGQPLGSGDQAELAKKCGQLINGGG